LKDFMSPELLNRIDHKIVFKPLGKDILIWIFKKELKWFLKSWEVNSSVKLPKLSNKKIWEIVDKIHDPQYGARPIERYIHDTIEPEIINQLLEDK
jgi:ATP-dependent Clp protease ATP-binding subunit ClpA